MLGTVLVRDGNTLVEIARHNQAAGGQRLACGFGTRQVRKLALNRFAYAFRHIGIRRQQDDLRVRAVLGLRKQVGGHEIRRCAAVGNDQHFRRTGWHVNCRAVKTLADLALGFGHKGIARAKNLVNLRDGLCAKGQRGNGLRTAHVKHLLHAAQFRGVKDLVGNRRWRAEHHFLTPGDTRRGRQHEYGGKQWGRAARDIKADRRNRARHLLAAHAGQGFHINGL